MKKADREKLKKMTLTEFKQKYPKLVENIRNQEREKLYDTMEKMKQRKKELEEKIKKKKEEKQRLFGAEIKELNETYNTLLAKKAELILKEQDYQHKALIKKKLKIMPSSLVAILEPALSLLSSSEAMDKEIEKTLKLYRATHLSEPIGGVMEKKELTAKEIEEKKQLQISKDFDEAFS